MRVVIQRVSEASVSVEGQVCGSISRGLLVLLGVEHGDTEADADFLVHKTLGLRVFPDSEHKMNLSVSDVAGSMLVVSQFTLYGDCRKGMRPSYDRAAPPADAKRLYEYFVARASESGIPIQTGVFQAMMQVHLVNDGPVTLICDSRPKNPNVTVRT
jgi:D-tyrosyl-tRNA(Tyr) deacylase